MQNKIYFSSSKGDLSFAGRLLWKAKTLALEDKEKVRCLLFAKTHTLGAKHVPAQDQIRLLGRIERELMKYQGVVEKIEHHLLPYRYGGVGEKFLGLMTGPGQLDVLKSILKQAILSPDTRALYQTLYRAQGDFIPLLKQAARRGIPVTVFVECQARGDEEKNRFIAQELAKAGVKVLTQCPFKVHAKLLLIEGKTPFVHIGTGNYHEAHGRSFLEASFCTQDEHVAQDGRALFHFLETGAIPRWHKLAVAPFNLKSKVLGLIATETQKARHGAPCLIQGQVNALTDPDVMDALYQASKAGVPVQLKVRGACGLIPHPNITVHIPVGRYLAHRRLFRFGIGPGQRLFLSSADWTTEKLTRRVEVLVEVVSKGLVVPGAIPAATIPPPKAVRP